MTTAIRTRTRAVQVEDNAGPEASEVMHAAAYNLFLANRAKNAAASVERKAQAELNALMAKESKGTEWEFIHLFTDNASLPEGSPVERTLDVRYAQTEGEQIDVKVLHGMVEPDHFLEIVTASKAAVKENAGSNVVAACTTKVTGDWKASAKVRK